MTVEDLMNPPCRLRSVTSSKRDSVVISLLLKMNRLQKIESNLKMPSDVLLTKRWSYAD